MLKSNLYEINKMTNGRIMSWKAQY